MITFPTVLFRHPDTRGLPGSSCLNEEPQAQWTENLFHNQLRTIPYVWCQWTALSILGDWLTPAQIQETANDRACMSDGFRQRGLWKTKVRLCGWAPPPPVPGPGMTLLLYYPFLSRPIFTTHLQRVAVKVSCESQNNQRYEHSYIGFSLFVYPKGKNSAARGI